MLVILSKSAQKEYQQLPKTDQSKILKRLHLLETEPLSGKKLMGELNDMRSLRAWPYRIIYIINTSQKRIEILKIAHRQGVYK